MALSEIEKLERRYAENPQGLTFAPLAEVHRKNGETQRALDLLKPGLALHPDYVPASIVLGRCHLDLGDVHAAETAFLHVLALDGENVIALKALADISERLLRLEDAERWLQTLLSVDRSNDDARAQLQRVEISRRQAEVASSAEPSGAAEATPAQSAGAAASEAPQAPGFEPPLAEPAMGWVSQSSQAADTVSGVQSLEPSAGRESTDELSDIELERPAGIQVEEPVLYDESVEPLDGLVGREVDTPVDSPEGAGDEFRVETSEDIVLRSSGHNEFQVPDASQEFFAAGAFGGRPPREEDKTPGSWSSAISEPASETLPESHREPTLFEATPAEPAEPEPAVSESAPFDAAAGWAAPSGSPNETERGAPRQGAELETASTSESAAPSRPAAESQAAGHQMVDELERSGAAERRPASEPMPEPAATPGPMWTSQPTATREPVATTEPPAAAAPMAGPGPPTEVAPEPEPAAAQAPPPRRAYAAGETGGRPVAQLLKGILSASPPAHSAPATVRQAPGAGGSGAPTRPAADALSLSSVFGEEAPAAPPAMPTASPGSGVSFDDFFGGPGATPTSRTQRNPDPKNDDLDQFHAWLQNLKR